uniref:acetolactate synthase n=1 Tax=viral metagenome TaxID=1070528 RepID=A0A6C0ELG6_9ZZZZ
MYNNLHRHKTGAELVYDKLVENNVKTVFGYSGGSIMSLIDQFHPTKNYGNINLIINTHEQSCGHAATGLSRTSNQTGVVIATSGPGCTNLVTPILDAQTDSIPLVVITGQVGLKNIGTNAFQEAPAVAITKPCTKWSTCVQDVNDIPYIMDKAFYIANEGKKGVVHIDLPKCVSADTVKDLLELPTYHKNSNQIPLNNEELLFIDKIAKVINNCQKPILYIGQGCIHASKELLDFINKSGIPCTSTIHGKGILSESHELSLEWCGMHGLPAANFAIQESDCVIAIGSRFDDRTTGNVDYYAPIARGKKQVIHIDIEPKQFNKALETNYNFKCDSKVFLSEILDKIDDNFRIRKRITWIKRIQFLKDKYPFKYTIPKNNKINTSMVINSINDHLKIKDYYITTGVGNHQMITYQYIKGLYPNKIHSSGSLGVMGVGLPYSIGAQLANPSSLVIDIDGDSSFMMTMNELKTIKEHNLPIKIAILNNSQQGMVNVWEQLFFDKRYTATINKHNPDFCMLANSFGIPSIKCNNYLDLDKTTQEFLSTDGPIVCEYVIEPEICLPLVGPGKALDDMIMYDDYNDSIIMDKSCIPS